MAKSAPAKTPAKTPAPAKSAPPASKKKVVAAAPAPEPEPEPEVEEEVTETETVTEDAVDDTLTIHDHLLDAARSVDANFAVKSAKEKRDVYVKRLIQAVGESDEDTVFNTLPEDVQAYYNDAVEAIVAEKSPADLPGLDDVKKKSGPEALAEYNRQRAADKAAGKTTTKTPKAPKEKVARSKSAQTWIREALIEDATMTVEALDALLTKQGFATERSTISTTRSGTLAVLELVHSMGHWKA